MNKFYGNTIETDKRCFDIGTNITPRFEIGEQSDQGAYLKGEFVGDNNTEPLFNGVLYHGGEGGQTTIIDNFPKSDVPAGWEKRLKLDNKGYELVDDLGNIIFSYWDDGQGDVKVSLRMYGSGGQLLANTSNDSLEIHSLVSFKM